MIKKILIIGLIFIGISFNAYSLDRFSNISFYQHTENNTYKLSFFTSFKQKTWFFQGVFDKFYTPNYQTYNYYNLMTFGKYITKKTSVRVQIEMGEYFHTNYYIGIGIDF